jgi:hypothetical protein
VWGNGLVQARCSLTRKQQQQQAGLLSSAVPACRHSIMIRGVLNAGDDGLTSSWMHTTKDLKPLND